MKIQTKKSVFDMVTQDWVLRSIIIEVNSVSEFKAAAKECVAEVRRHQAKAQVERGNDEQT